MGRLFMILGGVFAFLGVAAGAFGAHGLRDIIPVQYLQTFETGVRYQMYHAFGLFLTGWTLDRYSDTYFRFAGWMFTIGIVLFSGSLYLLSLTGYGWFGAVTPFGGVSFLAGWFLFVVGFLSLRK